VNIKNQELNEIFLFIQVRLSNLDYNFIS